jgi:hypothetical protein
MNKLHYIYTTSKIPSNETYPWLLKKHYAKRVPSISFAFGLYEYNTLCGVLTIGKSASSTLANGVCGKKESSYVYELNRLCVNEGLPKNVLSYFVGHVLKRHLPPLILISYADTSQNHNGYIYQATNWIYTGLSAKFKDPKVRGREHQHHATYANGLTNKEVIDKYGAENVWFVDRPRKHRYVYFTGSKKQKKYWKANLSYSQQSYPKGENSRYDASYKPVTQLPLFGKLTQ